MRQRPARPANDCSLLATGLSNLGRVRGAVFVSVLVAFLLFEGLEDTLALDDRTTHALHLVRGLSASLLGAIGAAVAVLTGMRLLGERDRPHPG